MHDPHRILNFPGLLNVRDLGGYPTRDGATTRRRSLLRADDLVQLTAEGVRAMAEYGVRTVIDLRWPEEVTARPHPVPHQLRHIKYYAVSLLGRSEEEWRLRRLDCSKEMWKCAVLEHTRRELREVLSLIARAEPGPLLFHCFAGKDRTGIIAALTLELADVEPDAIAYDYALSAEQLRAAYLQRYSDDDPASVIEAVRCPEEGVHNMLAYLQERGGIQAYLRGLGLSDTEIIRLRGRLRE